MIKSLRTMLEAQPNFRPVDTNPFAMLEDITVDGQNRSSGVTYAQMFSWIVDETAAPAVGTDAAHPRASGADRRVHRRWIYSGFCRSPCQDANGNTSTITVEVRFFYGYEVGSPQIQQQAQWRYLEAFWYGDVFLYTGHSHFGNGPLEPTHYGPQNFNSGLSDHADEQLHLVQLLRSGLSRHEAGDRRTSTWW